MHKLSLRAVAAGAALIALGLSAAPAAATTSEAFATNVVGGANTAIKNAMKSPKAKSAVGKRTVAQVPPVEQHPVGGAKVQQGLPTGFTYTADASMAFPYGNIGTAKGQWLPGGVDLVAGYGFNPTSRFMVSMYQLQHYPYGFNSGTVPLYLQGFANPVGCVNLNNTSANGCSPQNINVTTKDTFLFFNYEKLFSIKFKNGRVLPIVVTPTYVSRWSKIGASTQNDDTVPFAVNPPDGPLFFNTKTRSAQVWSLAVTVPFLKTPKMFGTFTVAPGWLNHPNGINGVNKAQLYQILYLEYTPNSKTKFFFEPQSSRDYLPTDPYAQHLFAYFLGVSRRLTKNTFVQLQLNSGGPSNETPYGVSAISCASITQCAPVVGGLKATQIQIQFGIGSPSVIQF